MKVCTQESALHYERFFPFDSQQKPSQNTLVIGIGGNVGDVLKRFECMMRWLFKNPSFEVIKSSPVYENPPFGITDQPMFFNAVVVIDTPLSYYQCFKILSYLEKRFGRNRRKEQKNGPRTLDIDLIFFNEVKLKRYNLILPHPEWHKRDSVTVPLSLLESHS